ncbi:hypothetical protein ACOMHN_015574 [Nucella lapillus]
MFALGLRAHPACSVSFLIVLVVLDGPCVFGRPPQAQVWPDTGRGPDPQASSSSNPALRFSPELLLEPSLESAFSPANVLPQPQPPTPPSASHPTSNNNNNNNLDSHYNVNNHNHIPVIASDVANDFSQDLDGPEENWEPYPDVEASEAVPPTESRPGRTPTGALQDKLPPAVMEDDLNVDRFHGNFLGLRADDGDEDLGIPELRLNGRDPGPFRSASTGSYVPFPHRNLDQGVSSTKLKSGDGEVESPPYFKTDVLMPDDVPVSPHLAVPWEEVLAKDIDVDKPISQETSAPVPQSASHFPDASSTDWKQLVKGELRYGDTTARASGGDGAMTSTDMDEKNNPFGEEDEESEVPEELVRQVVKAMESPSFWMETWGDEDDYDDDGDMWESSGDGEEEEEDYLDYWLLQERDGPWNSRLITLIFQAIDDPEDMLIYDDDGLEVEDENADAFNKEPGIWQVLTNFPFPMLLDDNDNTIGPINDDHIYDDEDYDEYYENYDEDYEDEYDDEDYDEYYDDEDSEEEESENEDESDNLDDYFYSEDCEDCAEDDAAAKPEIALLSLPPMLT